MTNKKRVMKITKKLRKMIKVDIGTTKKLVKKVLDNIWQDDIVDWLKLNLPKTASLATISHTHVDIDDPHNVTFPMDIIVNDIDVKSAIWAIDDDKVINDKDFVVDKNDPDRQEIFFNF